MRGASDKVDITVPLLLYHSMRLESAPTMKIMPGLKYVTITCGVAFRPR